MGNEIKPNLRDTCGEFVAALIEDGKRSTDVAHELVIQVAMLAFDGDEAARRAISDMLSGKSTYREAKRLWLAEREGNNGLR